MMVGVSAADHLFGHQLIQIKLCVFIEYILLINRQSPYNDGNISRFHCTHGCLIQTIPQDILRTEYVVHLLLQLFGCVTGYADCSVLLPNTATCRV